MFRHTKSIGVGASHLFPVVGKTTAQTAKSVCRTDDDRVADLLSGVQSLVDRIDGNRLGDRDVNLVQSPGEEITVLTELKGLNAGAKNLDAILLQDALPLELNTQVQGGLTTVGEEDAIGTLALENVGAVLGGDGKVVDLIGKGVVGLDSSDVRVKEYRGNAGLFESLQCLRTCKR